MSYSENNADLQKGTTSILIFFGGMEGNTCGRKAYEEAFCFSFQTKFCI